MGNLRGAVAVLLLSGACDAAQPATVGGSAVDARPDAPPPPDVVLADAPVPDDLGAQRDRLVASLGAPCAAWASLGVSERAVFLTITHRLFVSRTPDARSMLSHVAAVHAVLGGGSSGTSCGGADNNRVFLSTDAYLHGLLVDTWQNLTPISDGTGSTWIHTRDAAGPHDPFDASAETDIGLRCMLVFEQSDSRPPTGQAHFFTGAPIAFTRGTASLPADPFMLEVDQDYTCIHDSNPTCHDFEGRYRTNHGDFECEWVPSECTPTSTGCYRDVTAT